MSKIELYDPEISLAETLTWKEIYTLMFIAALFYNSQIMEAAQVSMNRRMNK